MATYKQSINLALIGLTLSAGASASVITIDFDSPNTGADLLDQPLTTPAGEVSADAKGGTLSLFEHDELIGQGLRFDQTDAHGYLQVNFSSTVDSVSFTFAGLGNSPVYVSAFDLNLVPVHTYDENLVPIGGYHPLPLQPGQYVNLNAQWGIDFLRFYSAEAGDAFVIDNLTLETADVPEPASLVLMGMGVAGLLWRRGKG